MFLAAFRTSIRWLSNRALEVSCVSRVASYRAIDGVIAVGSE